MTGAGPATSLSDSPRAHGTHGENEERDVVHPRVTIESRPKHERRARRDSPVLPDGTLNITYTSPFCPSRALWVPVTTQAFLTSRPLPPVMHESVIV